MNRGAYKIQGKIAVQACFYITFLAYSTHVLFSAIDGQSFLELYGYNDGSYGQIVSSSWGQVLLVAYVGARARTIIANLRKMEPFLVLLCVFAVYSCTWSIDGLTTLHRAADLALAVVFPFLALEDFGTKGAIRLTWFFGSALLILSCVLALTGSRYAVMSGGYEGIWRGLFGHKNEFGRFAACLALFTFACAAHLAVSRRVRVLIGAIAVVATIKSESASALVALAMAGLVGTGVYFLRRAPITGIGRYVFALLLLATTASIASEVSGFLLSAVGRDSTLTGRTELWEGALPFVYAAPFGYGYGLSGGQEVLDGMRRASGWLIAPSTHNGYIAMALDFGWLLAGGYVVWLAAKIAPMYAPSGRFPDLKDAISVIAALQFAFGVTEAKSAAYLTFPFYILVLLIAAERWVLNSSMANPARDRKTMPGSLAERGSLTGKAPPRNGGTGAAIRDSSGWI